MAKIQIHVDLNAKVEIRNRMKPIFSQEQTSSGPPLIFLAVVAATTSCCPQSLSSSPSTDSSEKAHAIRFYFLDMKEHKNGWPLVWYGTATLPHEHGVCLAK